MKIPSETLSVINNVFDFPHNMLGFDEVIPGVEFFVADNANRFDATPVNKKFVVESGLSCSIENTGRLGFLAKHEDYVYVFLFEEGATKTNLYAHPQIILYASLLHREVKFSSCNLVYEVSENLSMKIHSKVDVWNHNLVYETRNGKMKYNALSHYPRRKKSYAGALLALSATLASIIQRPII